MNFPSDTATLRGVCVGGVITRETSSTGRDIGAAQGPATLVLNMIILGALLKVCKIVRNFEYLIKITNVRRLRLYVSFYCFLMILPSLHSLIWSTVRKKIDCGDLIIIFILQDSTCT